MRKNILNIFAMTGVTLVVLSLVALCYKASFLCLDTVFQALGVNALIYFGVYIINKFEIPYFLLETTIKLIYSIGLILVFGMIFGWYSSLSVTVLTIMSLAILLICTFLDTLSINGEINEINQLIQDK
ncbi:MAG: hypothetical protein E7275_08365 [Pseudobutyrivibrio sp.]|uniref:hypothetical protein n=1 Tax=Pseudobutyrivibrio sp. TaxID=2014367 RepID=UPI0025E25DF7|nr:hypothetical protein [Pseudobutyrivibrio sp.]MBE5904287.1 hypothetical protein [Pseudobutyrivibrio sp.]